MCVCSCLCMVSNTSHFTVTHMRSRQAVRDCKVREAHRQRKNESVFADFCDYLCHAEVEPLSDVSVVSDARRCCQLIVL